MSLLAPVAVVLLSLLLLHAVVAPLLHGVAHWMQSRGRAHAGTSDRARATFLLLSMPPLLVAVLGLSGFGHLAEGEGALAAVLTACARFHEHCDLLLSGATSETLVYAGLVSVIGGWLGRAGWLAWAPTREALALPEADLSPDEQARIGAAVELARSPAPVQVVHAPAGAALTAGFLRPRVLVSLALVQALSVEQLAAVLGHEIAHIRRHDVARSLVVRFVSALSPFAWRRAGVEASYELDREILCDRAAVRDGADPLALADALLIAARLRSPAGRIGALGGLPAATGHHDTTRAVTTRVRLLLADDHDEATGALRTLGAVGLALAVATLLPHAAFGLTVTVHCGVESLIHLLA